MFLRQYILICVASATAMASLHATGKEDQLRRIIGSFEVLSVSEQSHFIKSIYQDTRGFIWMGHLHSLVRYDGTSIHEYTYHPERQPAMLLSGPEVIEEDSAGRLWLVSWSDGLVIFDPASDVFLRPEGSGQLGGSLPSARASDVLIDKAGTAWVSTRDFSLYQVDPTTFAMSRYHFEPPGAPDDFAALGDQFGQIIEDVQDPDLLWIGSKYGLARFSRSEKQFDFFAIDTVREHRYRQIPAPMFMDRYGQIWFGHYNGGGVRVFDTRRLTWTHRIAAEAEHGRTVGSNRVFGIYPYQDSLVLAMTWWNHLTLASQRNPDDHVILPYTPDSRNCQGFLVDALDRVWVGMQDQLLVSRRPDDPFRYFSLVQFADPTTKFNGPSGLFHDPVRDHYLVSTVYGDGLYIFKWPQGPGRVVRYSSEAGSPNPDVNMKGIVPDGRRVWIPSSGGLLTFNLDSETFHRFDATPQEEEILHPYPLDMHRMPDGFWITPPGGGVAFFSVIDEAITPLLGELRLLPDLTFRVVRPIGDSLLLLISDETPILLDLSTGSMVEDWLDSVSLQRCRQYGTTDGLVQEDTLWLTTKGNGLAKVILGTGRPYRTQFYWTDHAPGANVMNRLMLSREGQIWIASNYGFSYFDQAAKSFLTFGVSDGVGFPNRQFWVGQLESGEICARANKGFEFFDPRSLVNETAIVRPYLKAVTRSHAPLAVEPGEIARFGPRDDHLAFAMGALNFHRNPRTVFKYLLEGYDKTWRTTEQSVVNYTNLPEGDYRFRFTASSNGYVWSPDEVVVPIYKAPPFIRSRTFYVLAAALLLACAVLLFHVMRVRRQRKDQLQRQEAELLFLQKERAEAELTALRAQMNPHFLFNSLNSINWYIIKNRPKEASRYLTRFSKLVRQILEFSKSETITLEQELACLRMYIDLERMRFERAFEVSIEVDGSINPGHTRIPPLVIQPFVENAIWHGLMRKEGDKRLVIRITSLGSQLHIQVVDNGIGRKAAADSKKGPVSQGMSITRNRLSPGNGAAIPALEVTDLYDEQGRPAGTRVDLYLPLDTRRTSPEGLVAPRLS
ncbi:MAG: histidine kinase [Saprospiraceae bacterium]|nr:histidine kinase [Saprospiraceae bacterium]